MKIPKKAHKVRVQLDLSPQQTDALDALRDQCGFRSRADAVRAALAILGWVQAETELGRRVVAIDGENTSWFVMPGITDRPATSPRPSRRVEANRS